MNKPRIFPKSLNQGVQISKCANLVKSFTCLIGYICKSSEYYSFTVYECQHAEITLVFVPTSIFTFSYTTDIK